MNTSEFERIIHMSPREFMKGRRPEKFSDSHRVVTEVWDRPRLEYHLDYITNRSEEILFEKFSIQLLKKIIAPNLSTQAGPMGGGDGKVDSETHIVADGLSLHWNVTDEILSGANERWAVAISTKKDWKSKLHDDIRKISGTQRGYVKAFFVSSRYIPSKDKHKEEDNLSRKYSIRVTIFDREWILDQILSNHLESLFSKHLNYSDSASTIEEKIGQNDKQRRDAIAANEDRIRILIDTGGNSPEVIRLYLEIAILRRGLERPQDEVKSSFARALRLAKSQDEIGSIRECHYNICWTAAWWHEDWETFVESYAAFRSLIDANCNYDEIEHLSNLFTIYVSQQRAGRILAETEVMVKESEFLKARLDAIATREDLPNASLSARSTRAFLDIILDPKSAPVAFKIMLECVNNAKGKIGFSVSRITELVIQLEQPFGDLSEYSELYEALVEVSTSRLQAREAARLLLKRSLVFTNKHQFDRAIVFTGRAIELLKASEHPDLLSGALLLLSSCYGDMGLPWASRTACLTAFSVSAMRGIAPHDVSDLQARCIYKIKWAELKVGWISHAVECFLVERGMRTSIRADFVETEEYVQEKMLFEAGLIILLLRIPTEKLSAISYIPDRLELIGLDMAASAALHVLGHPDGIPDGEAKNIFPDLLKQPMANQLNHSAAVPGNGADRIFSSISGCNIFFEFKESDNLSMPAKALAGFIESFLATCLSRRIAPKTPQYKIILSLSDNCEENGIDYKVEMTGSVPATIIEFKSMGMNIMEILEVSHARFREAGLISIVHAYNIEDFESQFRAMAEEENAFSRGADAIMSISAEHRLYGNRKISEFTLFDFSNVREYGPIRNTANDIDTSSPVENDGLEAQIGKGIPPEDLLKDPVSHDEIKMAPLIRPHLWDMAKWFSLGFMGNESGSIPPTIIFIFREPASATTLWENIIKDIKEAGVGSPLRISILSGIAVGNPYAYRVTLMASEKWAKKLGSKRQFIIGRANTMEPKDGANLARFIGHFNKHNSCYLEFGIMTSAGPQPLGLQKINVDNVVFRRACDVGPNELDSCFIHDDDEVIIPPDLASPPVVKLREINSQRKSKPGHQ